MVPARAVEQRALEGLETVDVRQARMVEHARRRDDGIDLVVVATRRLEMPATVDEFAARDLVTEARLVLHAMLARDTLEIGLDLGAGREPMTPIRGERK